MERSPVAGLDGSKLSRQKTSSFPEGAEREIASRVDTRDAADAVGISLLFAGTERPDAAAIRTLAEGARGFSVSHDPGAAAPGHPANGASGSSDWLEVLSNGLTFDLSGLAPASGQRPPERAYCFDLPPGLDPSGLEAIGLTPGPHLVAGARMMPVVRAMAGLAASLCALPGLVAVAWHPARSWIGPRYFTSIIGNWLEGGVFPGLGLVGLATVADGGMQSEGLSFFTDQELRIEPELTGDRAGAAKIAVRLIDRLIEHGRLESAETIAGPEGRLLQIEPSGNGRLVRVWSGS